MLSVSICVIKILRVILEVMFISDSVTFVSDEWKNQIKKTYHYVDGLQIKFALVEIIQGIILMMTMLVVSIP